ncbi:MAG: hypothetical protein ACYSTG_10580, partial [Planctomycetota bacterium]
MTIHPRKIVPKIEKVLSIPEVRKRRPGMLRIIALCAVTMGTVLPVLAQPTDPDCFTEGGWPRRHCDDPKWVATLNINKTRFFPGDTVSIEYEIPNHWPKRDGTCSGCIGIIKNYKQ